MGKIKQGIPGGFPGTVATVAGAPWQVQLKKKPRPFYKDRGLTKLAAAYSPTLLCSTIGAVGLNFSVRNGKRWGPNAIAT